MSAGCPMHGNVWCSCQWPQRSDFKPAPTKRETQPEKWSDEWIGEFTLCIIGKRIPDSYAGTCILARTIAAQAFEEAATFIETHRPTFHSGVAKIKAEPNGRGAGAYPDETQKCYAAAIRARAEEVADGNHE